VFHVSEFTAMASVAIEYAIQTGDRESAKQILNVMKQIAPDHETTRAMQARMRPSPLEKLLTQMARRLDRRHR
jgi:hypothetical protein